MANQSSYLVIDNVQFRPPMISVERTTDALYKYAERMETGDLEAELIGWFQNYRVETGFFTDRDAYKALYDKITEPVAFHVVSLPTTMGMTPSYEAYFAGISDRVIRLKPNSRHVWIGLGFDVIARRPHKRA